MIAHVGKIVNFIRKSILDSETLSKLVDFKLPAMNQTRWNSQFLMITKFLNALDKDSQIQNKLKAFEKHSKMSALEIKVLREVVIILQPFTEATDEFQADYESVGLVIPAYLDMKNKMSVTDSSCPIAGKIHYCADVADALLTSLETCLSYVLSDTFYVLGKIPFIVLHRCFPSNPTI